MIGNEEVRRVPIASSWRLENETGGVREGFFRRGTRGGMLVLVALQPAIISLKVFLNGGSCGRRPRGRGAGNRGARCARGD